MEEENRHTNGTDGLFSIFAALSLSKIVKQPKKNSLQKDHHVTSIFMNKAPESTCLYPSTTACPPLTPSSSTPDVTCPGSHPLSATPAMTPTRMLSPLRKWVNLSL